MTHSRPPFLPMSGTTYTIHFATTNVEHLAIAGATLTTSDYAFI